MWLKAQISSSIQAFNQIRKFNLTPIRVSERIDLPSFFGKTFI